MINDLFGAFGLSNEAAGLLVGVITLVIAVLPSTWRLVARLWRWLLLSTGVIDRKYSKWFVDVYYRAYNPVLEEHEELGLNETFVPLTVALGTAAPSGERDAKDSRSATTHEDGATTATSVMSNRNQRCIMIVGDPGTGKSTVLRAYGVGILRRRRRRSRDMLTIQPSREIPLLIPLRGYGRDVDKYDSLLKYLEIEILQNQAKLGRYAGAYLARLLRSRRCLVLLDGMDEVAPQETYIRVRDRIRDFRLDHCIGTKAGARIITTFRTQNFQLRRHEWIGPDYCSAEHALAPFRDGEIRRYAEKLKPYFTAKGHSPATFFNAVMRSNAEIVKLHRVPLVLSMSLGLYARLDSFEIPPSVAVLYKRMISYLLGRRQLLFLPSQKLAVLRTFALEVARKNGGFDDFQRPDLVAVAERVIPQLPDVRPEQAFELVDEIINTSGVIARQSDEGMYNFTHRSIFEYLAAEQLARDPEMAFTFLYEVAANPEWRQVTLFYVSDGVGRSDDMGQRRPHVARLVSHLARPHREFAAYCLGQASVDLDIAEPVLRSIGDKIDQSSQYDILLPSLLRATHSPVPAIRKRALELSQRAIQKIVSRGRVGVGFGGDVAALTDIVHDIATADSAEMVELVPKLMNSIPDDRGLVRPLIQCLEHPHLDSKIQRDIVNRLLQLAMQPACFEELERCEPFTAVTFSETQRHKAFPFRTAAKHARNLVTLLAWAERFDTRPQTDSKFFALKSAHPRAFAQLERDKRFTREIPLRWLPPIVRLLGVITALIVSIGAGGAALREGFDAFTSAMGAIGIIFIGVPTLLTLLIMMLTSGVPGLDLDNSGWHVLSVVVLPFIYAVAWLPAAADSIPFYTLTAVATSYVVVVLPATDIAQSLTSVFVPPLNPCLGIYTDPTCRHWLIRHR